MILIGGANTLPRSSIDEVESFLNYINAKSSFMEYIIKGIIHGSENHPLPNITIKAFDRDPFSSNLLVTSTSDTSGKFDMTFSEDQYNFLRLEGKPEVYLVINDEEGKFQSVKDKQGAYEKGIDFHGNTVWIGNVIENISDLDKCNITAVT
jgi:hypothetical protein